MQRNFRSRECAFLVSFVLWLASAVANAQAPWRLLVYSETAGFRHASIDDGQELLQDAAPTSGFATTESESSSIFSIDGLAPFHAVVFLNTTGDVLTAAEQSALDCFLRSGGGWIGVHSAADTEHGWPGYGEILGGDAWFAIHPAIQSATIERESSAHPSTSHWPATFSFTDEWYNFAANPRLDPAVDVLLTIDEDTYEPGTGAMGDDHPISWSHPIGAGRSWYTNLGHSDATYDDAGFAQHLLGGVLWAARCAGSACRGGLIFRDGLEAASVCRWSASEP